MLKNSRLYINSTVHKFCSNPFALSNIFTHTLYHNSQHRDRDRLHHPSQLGIQKRKRANQYDSLDKTIKNGNQDERK